MPVDIHVFVAQVARPHGRLPGAQAEPDDHSDLLLCKDRASGSFRIVKRLTRGHELESSGAGERGSGGRLTFFAAPILPCSHSPLLPLSPSCRNPKIGTLWLDGCAGIAYGGQNPAPVCVAAVNAVFTRGELAMALAALLASASEAAPSTRTVINLVAPSPSRTIC